MSARREFAVRGEAEVSRVLKWSPRSLAYDLAPGPDGQAVLTDWASWGTYAAGDSVVESARSLAFPFDHAVVGPDGWVVVLERAGTKAVVLKDGVVVREVNRSFAHASSYEYPMAVTSIQGRIVLVHCPQSYSRIDVEDILTGEVLTKREARMGGAFHSRFSVSPDGSLLLSAGWVWSPRNVVGVFDLAQALERPESLDANGVLPLNALLDEPSSAAWAPDSSLVVSNEPYEDDLWDAAEARSGLLSGELGRWSFTEGRWVSRVEVSQALGDMVVSVRGPGEQAGLVGVGVFGRPRGVDISSGREVFEVDVDSGRRSGPFMSRAPQAWAFDPVGRRVAVARGGVVVEVSY